MEKLNLLTATQVPQDANLIVVAGAQHPLTEEEVTLISDYLEEGGALMVLSEPLPLTEFGDSEDLLASYLEENWGVKLGADIVFDQTSSQPYVAYADRYGDHAITGQMQRVGTAYPTARSLQLVEGFEGINPVELVFTAQQSWAESDLQAISDGSEISVDENDRVGPLTVAVAVENAANEGRVVVFGDADFAANANFNFLGNGDMFVNAVDWAVGQEELINLTPRSSTQRVLLPPQPYMINLVLLGVVFVLPGTVLASGIVVWVRRRRRG